MNKDYHPLVLLMLARIKSYPEEFEVDPIESSFPERWGSMLMAIEEYACEEGKRLVSEAVNAVRMDQAHRYAMDELLNGNERRAEAKAETDNLMASLTSIPTYPTAGMYNQASADLQGYQNSLQNSYQNMQLGQLGQNTLLGLLKGKLGL